MNTIILAKVSAPVLWAYFVFLMAYYYFVLRKYNTLGFRMFSLFFFTGIAVCYWWYVDDLALKKIQHTGISTNALVVKKSENSLQFHFTDPTGKEVELTQEGGISVEEFASVNEGQPAPILYSPGTKTVFLASSYQRQLHDNVYILFFPGLLFLIGFGCLFFLRKYRVHAHGDGSIMEYVTNEEGKVVLDDNANVWTRGLRRYSTFSKLFDLFRR